MSQEEISADPPIRSQRVDSEEHPELIMITELNHRREEINSREHSGENIVNAEPDKMEKIRQPTITWGELPRGPAFSPTGKVKMQNMIDKIQQEISINKDIGDGQDRPKTPPIVVVEPSEEDEDLPPHRGRSDLSIFGLGIREKFNKVGVESFGKQISLNEAAYKKPVVARRQTISRFSMRLRNLKQKLKEEKTKEKKLMDERVRQLNPLLKLKTLVKGASMNQADLEKNLETIKNDEYAFRSKVEDHYSRSRLSSMEIDAYYDDYEHPPDLETCKLHGLSQRIGIRQPLRDAQETDIAPSIVKSSVVFQHKICFDDSDLSYLGTGYVLYFFFLKCLILICGLVSLVTGYTAITYFRGSNCTEANFCNQNVILMFTIANYGLNANHFLRILLAVMIFVISLLNLWMISYARKVDRKADVSEDSPSDYTLMFSGLPNLDSEEEITKTVNELIIKWKTARSNAKRFASAFAIIRKKKTFTESQIDKPDSDEHPFGRNRMSVDLSSQINTYMSRLNKNSLQNRLQATAANAAPNRDEVSTSNKKLTRSEAFKSQYSFAGNKKIEKVSKAYNLGDFSAIIDQIIHLRRLRAKHRVKVDRCKDRYEYQIAHQHMKKVLALKKEISKYKALLKRLRKSLNTSYYSTGIAFVSFQYKKDRDLFLREFRSTFWNTYIFSTKGFEYKGRKIRVEQAPEPSDIIWQNLGESTFNLIKRRVYTYTASTLLLFLSFIVVLMLKSYQLRVYQDLPESQRNQPMTSSQNLKFLAISGSISVVIMIINQVLDFTMLFFCELEKHNSVDDFNMSYMKKLVRLQFFNTCGVLSLSHMILNHDGASGIWQQGGLIYDACIILLSKFVMLPLKIVLDPKVLIKWIQRRLLEKNVKRSEMLQYEANELYTGSELNLSGAFGDGLEVYYACMFFLPIVPISSFALLLSMISLLYLQKYMFARVYKRPPEIGSNIALESIYMIGMGPFILLGSIMLNDYIFEREQGASFIILLVVSGVCLIIHLSIGRKLSILALRMDTINSEGNLKDKKHFLKPYSKVRHYFDNEYDRANPITSEEKTKEYLRWIFVNGYLINNEFYEKMTGDMGLDHKELKSLMKNNASAMSMSQLDRSNYPPVTDRAFNPQVSIMGDVIKEVSEDENEAPGARMNRSPHSVYSSVLTDGIEAKIQSLFEVSRDRNKAAQHLLLDENYSEDDGDDNSSSSSDDENRSFKALKEIQEEIPKELTESIGFDTVDSSVHEDKLGFHRFHAGTPISEIPIKTPLPSMSPFKTKLTGNFFSFNPKQVMKSQTRPEGLPGSEHIPSNDSGPENKFSNSSLPRITPQPKKTEMSRIEEQMNAEKEIESPSPSPSESPLPQVINPKPVSSPLSQRLHPSGSGKNHKKMRFKVGRFRNTASMIQNKLLPSPKRRSRVSEKRNSSSLRKSVDLNSVDEIEQSITVRLKEGSHSRGMSQPPSMENLSILNRTSDFRSSKGLSAKAGMNVLSKF